MADTLSQPLSLLARPYQKEDVAEREKEIALSLSQRGKCLHFLDNIK